MSFQTTIDTVAVCIQAQIPCCITSRPGHAKTAITTQLFKQLCDEYHTSIAALHEPPEYGGYAVPQSATETEPAHVALLPLGWVHRLARAKQRAGLCLDELSNAAPATRSAAMRGIHEGVWGEVHIPKLSTVACMNPVDITESGYELSAPLANRFCHVDWAMPPEFWLDQMLAGFPPPNFPRLPEGWRAQHLPYAQAMLAGFGKHTTGLNLLDALPAEASRRAGPYPSYRTWTYALDLIAAARSLGHTERSTGGDELVGLSPLLLQLVAGCVGPEAARAFFLYTAELDLPDPEDLLAAPGSLRLPARGDKVYAILASVAAAVMANNTPERWVAGFNVLARAAELGAGDLAAAAARLLASDRVRPRSKADQSKAGPAMRVFAPILQAAGLTG